MRYGATNNPFQPLSREIRDLAGLGFDYVELCLDPPRSRPEDLDPEAVRDQAAAHGLGLDVAHLPTFVWIADVYDAIRDASVAETIKALEFVGRLGIPKAVLHPGYLTPPMRGRVEWGAERVGEAVARLIDHADGLNVTLCLENLFHRAGHMDRPEDMVRILDAFPTLMMTLDIGHAAIRAPRNRLFDMIDRCAGRIAHVHVSDNNGQEDDHLPVGAGRVDVAGAVRELKRAGYDRTVTLEVFAPDRDYLKTSLIKVKAMHEEA
jgi:sugar phosphate isomerase/epimerase